jgi:hypothetical protein
MRASLARLDAVLASPISGLTYEAIGMHLLRHNNNLSPSAYRFSSRINRNCQSLWIFAFLVSAICNFRGCQQQDVYGFMVGKYCSEIQKEELVI